MAGLAKTIGNGTATNSFIEIGLYSNCVLMIGSNPENGHPIAAMHIQRALSRGAKLIVIDPVKTEFASKADIHLQIPAEHNIVILNSLLYVVIEEGLTDEKFIKECTRGFEYAKFTAKDYAPEVVAPKLGVKAEDIRAAARMYATLKPAAITHGMGITHFNHGVANVCAISNLFLATGNICELGSGDYPLRGQQNVQGSCDMGMLVDTMPNLGKVSDPKVRDFFEDLWHLPKGFLNPKVGIHKTLIPDAILDGRVHFFWTVGENPVISEPNTNHFLKAMAKVDFYVVTDIFLTETALKADVVLPAVSVAEKEGCYINAERRVQHNSMALDPIGDVRQDWWIICEVAKRLGSKEFEYTAPEQIWEEIRKADPRRFGGMSYYRLKKENGVHWPCPDEKSSGTPSLYLDRKFYTPDGIANFVPVVFVDKTEDIEPAKQKLVQELNLPDEYPVMAGSIDEPTDDEYPIVLLTTRKVYQYTVGTMTRRSSDIELGGDSIGPIAEMCQSMADRYGLKNGDLIKVTSRHGYISIKVSITDTIIDGAMQMTFHYWESLCNELTSSGLDFISKTPTYKAAVKVEKITEEEHLRIRELKLLKFKTSKIIYDDFHAHHTPHEAKDADNYGCANQGYPTH